MITVLKYLQDCRKEEGDNCSPLLHRTGQKAKDLNFSRVDLDELLQKSS